MDAPQPRDGDPRGWSEMGIDTDGLRPLGAQHTVIVLLSPGGFRPSGALLRFILLSPGPPSPLTTHRIGI